MSTTNSNDQFLNSLLHDLICAGGKNLLSLGASDALQVPHVTDLINAIRASDLPIHFDKGDVSFYADVTLITARQFVSALQARAEFFSRSPNVVPRASEGNANPEAAQLIVNLAAVGAVTLLHRMRTVRDEQMQRPAQG